MSRYVELVIHGDDRDLKGYLSGHFAASASGPVRMLYADEAGFELHHVRERIKHHGDVQHVIVETKDAARVRAALAAAAPRYDFNIKDERAVDRGHFSFEFDTPSRDVAGRLKDLLGHLPVGTVLKNCSPEEKTIKDGGSAELYTPLHDYQFKGQGEISGDLFALVEARRSVLAIDFTRCQEIEIDE